MDEITKETAPIFKKEFIKWLLAGISGLFVLCISFYFTTNSRLNDHEEKIQILTSEKASSKDIEYMREDMRGMKDDLRDVKAGNQRIYEILLEKDKGVK